MFRLNLTTSHGWQTHGMPPTPHPEPPFPLVDVTAHAPLPHGAYPSQQKDGILSWITLDQVKRPIARDQSKDIRHPSIT